MPALTVSTSIPAGRAGEYGETRVARGGSGAGGCASRPFVFRSAADGASADALVGSTTGVGADAGFPAACFPFDLDFAEGAGRARMEAGATEGDV